LVRSSRWVIAAVFVWAGWAQASNPYLTEALAMYRRLDYSNALKRLDVARRVPTNSREDQEAILDLLARCQVAEGRVKDAEATFTELLLLKPRHQLEPNASPKILTPFKSARARLYPEGFVSLKLETGTPEWLTGQLVDPHARVTQLRLFFRKSTDVRFESEALPLQGDLWEHRFDSPHAWYVEAIDDTGAVVASVGSAALPGGAAQVTVEPELRTAPAQFGTARRTALYVTAALALASLATGTVLQLQSQRAANEAKNAEWADDALRGSAAAAGQARVGNGFFVAAGAATAGAFVLWVW
jgi:hypothetical protein